MKYQFLFSLKNIQDVSSATVVSGAVRIES